MSRTKLILPVASACCCLLFAACVHAQEPDGRGEDREREFRLQLVEAEFDIKMHEVEFVMSERALEEAKIEIAKAELNVSDAEKRGGSDRVEFAKLELKKAHIGLEMQKLRSEMARLQIERAKTRLQLKQPAIIRKREKRAGVQLEYDEEMDIVIIRGAKFSVDKIRALIENAAKEQDE